VVGLYLLIYRVGCYALLPEYCLSCWLLSCTSLCIVVVVVVVVVSSVDGRCVVPFWGRQKEIII
jgi:hypothetical protein